MTGTQVRKQLEVACLCGKSTRRFTTEQIKKGHCSWTCHRRNCAQP